MKWEGKIYNQHTPKMGLPQSGSLKPIDKLMNITTHIPMVHKHTKRISYHLLRQVCQDAYIIL